MISRRSFLGGLSAVAVGAPLLGSAPAHGSPRADGLRLTLLNDTGSHSGDQVWTYVVGTNLATGQQSRVTADGALVPVSTADNGPDGYTDYAIAVAAGGTTLTLPRGMSGRIYLAIGEKLKFHCNEGNALAYPAGWVDSDPNFPILHDCVEFTFDNGGMHCNTTMVDMLSIPLAIDLTGAARQSTGRLRDGGRAAIFSALSGQAGFGDLVVDDLRVIAPGHGLEAGRFSGDYFAGHVDEVWERYRGQDLVVSANNTTFTGRVTGDTFAFDHGVRAFGKPSTRDVLFCDGALAAPNDGVTGPVAAVLGAGFNRGVLLDSASQPTTDPGAYYTHDVTNHYSRVMHANTVDGKAYGFAFDDVCGFASYIEDGAPTAMTVTMTAF